MSHGQVRFWTPTNLNRASLVLRFLASTFASDPIIIGLQILNEPRNNDQLGGWYEKTIDEVRAVAGRDFPVYIHDTWDMNYYCPLAGRRDEFVVVDHHLYRCFTDEDRTLTGPQHAEKLRHDFRPKMHDWAGKARGALIIGEWSAGLADWELLPKGTPAGVFDDHKRQWVAAQLEVYDAACAGYFFWTLKSDKDWEAGWSAKNAAQAEILPASLVRRRFHHPDGGRRETEIHRATGTYIVV